MKPTLAERALWDWNAWLTALRERVLELKHTEQANLRCWDAWRKVKLYNPTSAPRRERLQFLADLRMVSCAHCRGHGRQRINVGPRTRLVKCLECNGTGDRQDIPRPPSRELNRFLFNTFPERVNPQRALS